MNKTLRLLIPVTLLGTSFSVAGPANGGARAERSRPERSPSRETAPAAPTVTTARPQPTGATISAQQKANLQTLQTDLAAIKAGSSVTPEQKSSVKTSLTAIADGATKPSEASVTALTSSLTAALADESVSTKEKAQITKNVQAVLTSANIPADEVDALIASTSALLTASGISHADAALVVYDLRAIATELKANAATKTAPASKPAQSTTQATANR